MTAPYQRKRDWAAALKRRPTREHFIKAGMLPPAFFFCANTEDNERGVVVDIVSGIQATLIGSAGFGYNHAPNMHGRLSPPRTVPVITLPTGAGLAFPGLRKLVAGANTPLIFSAAVKMNGLNRPDIDGPQYIYRTLVARPLRNPGGTNTNYSGWSIAASDYKEFFYDTAYSTRVYVKRARTPTVLNTYRLSSPYQSVGITRPPVAGSLLAWSTEMGKASNTQSSIITGSPLIGYYTSVHSSNVVLDDRDDRPLLVGCTRDETTDSYYTDFLDGEILFLAVWTADQGAVVQNSYTVGVGTTYGNYVNDPVEMFRRLALAMDEGGGTRPFCQNTTYYVSDAETGSYPVIDTTWETIAKGSRIIINGAPVEVLYDYPNAQDQIGNYSYQMRSALVADIPDVYSFKNQKLTVRPLPRGTEAEPTAAAQGLRLIEGDTVIYKDTHTFAYTDTIRGGYGSVPVTVFMPDTSAASAVLRTSGHVALVGGASSPKTLTLQQLNGRLTAYRLGLGQCGTFSMWNCGATTLIDCVIKPSFYWAFSGLDQNVLGMDATYEIANSTTIALPDLFGTTSPIVRRSVRMYGGATYGSAGEVSAGSVGSVLRMYGVNSVHRPLDYTTYEFRKVTMHTGANMYSAISKVVRIGGVAAMPGVTPGGYSIVAGYGTRHDPSFVYADNLTPRGSLPAISTQSYTVSGPVTDTYRLASPARRDGLPYSWRMQQSSINKDRLFYVPFRSRLRATTPGTAVRVNLAGVDSTSVASLGIRVVYTKVGGARGSVYVRGTGIVLNSISNTLWVGAAPTAAYTDIACPGLAAGPVEVSVTLSQVLAVEPLLHVDPHIMVI